MAAFLLKNWRLVLVGVLIVSLALSQAYARNLRQQRDSQKERRLTAEANFKVCLNDKRITYEASSEYQASLASVNRKLADLQRVRQQAKCIPVTRTPR